MSATKSTIPRPDAMQLRVLYVDRGLGCPEIGRIFGRDSKTVLWWLRQAGIPTRPRGSDTRQHFKSGQRSAFAGRKHTMEARKRIGAASAGRAWASGAAHWLYGAPPERNPNWKGGATPERQEFYRSPEWAAVVRYVWARDNACCRNCGKDWRTVDRATEPTFHIHHVWSFQIRETRLHPSLLVLLCRPCHLWVHSKANATGAWLPQEPDSPHFPPFEDLQAMDQVHYLKSAERQVSMPGLFDVLESEKVAA